MDTNKKPLRILLADDHTLFRKGLKALLESRADYHVCGESSTGCEAIEKSRELKPDLILMDIDMPKMNGLEATKVIKHEAPDINIIILTVSDYATQVFDAIKFGASGYLLKNLEPEDMFEMLEKNRAGEPAINGILATKILAEFSRISQMDHTHKKTDDLSEREKEVLKFVARGLDNKEIANELSIAPSTVKTHLSSILEKLHLRNRVEAAVYAVGEGLVNYLSNCKK